MGPGQKEEGGVARSSKSRGGGEDTGSAEKGSSPGERGRKGPGGGSESKPAKQNRQRHFMHCKDQNNDKYNLHDLSPAARTADELIQDMWILDPAYHQWQGEREDRPLRVSSR